MNGVLVHNVLDDILIRSTDVNHMSDVAQLLNKKGVDLVEDHYAAGVLWVKTTKTSWGMMAMTQEGLIDRIGEATYGIEY